MSDSWRDIAISHIAYSIIHTEYWINSSDKALKDGSLSDEVNKKRYPFGSRRYTPYKVWLEEIRLLRVFLTTGKSLDCYQPWRAQFTSKGERRGRSNSPSSFSPSPGQLTVFVEG
jgi:hypothetical protein